MRAENTFGIDFIIRQNKRNKVNALLFARVTIDGVRKEISLKQRIETAHWDGDSERVKGKGPEVQQLNNYIEKVRYLLTEKYRLLVDRGNVITAQLVKEAFLSKQTIKRSGHSLRELMTYHTTINKDVLADGTMKNYYYNFIKLAFK